MSCFDGGQRSQNPSRLRHLRISFIVMKVCCLWSKGTEITMNPGVASTEELQKRVYYFEVIMNSGSQTDCCILRTRERMILHALCKISPKRNFATCLWRVKISWRTWDVWENLRNHAIIALSTLVDLKSSNKQIHEPTYFHLAFVNQFSSSPSRSVRWRLRGPPGEGEEETESLLAKAPCKIQLKDKSD